MLQRYVMLLLFSTAHSLQAMEKEKNLRNVVLHAALESSLRDDLLDKAKILPTQKTLKIYSSFLYYMPNASQETILQIILPLALSPNNQRLYDAIPKKDIKEHHFFIGSTIECLIQQQSGLYENRAVYRFSTECSVKELQKALKNNMYGN